jgi:hypothetical protein
MAQLRIQYNQIADLGVEYALRATIEQTTSEPDALDNCLVVKKGDAGSDEELMRVGDFAEVVTTPKDALPATVSLFSAASLSLILGGILPGDVINVVPPFIWTQYYGSPNPFQTVVDTVVSPTEVIVVTPFPAFGRQLTFDVFRSLTVILPVTEVPPYPIDGVANRDYTLVSGTEFLTNDQASSWANIDTANGRYAAMQEEAQLLVNAMKEDTYSGQSDKVYS